MAVDLELDHRDVVGCLLLLRPCAAVEALKGLPTSSLRPARERCPQNIAYAALAVAGGLCLGSAEASVEVKVRTSTGIGECRVSTRSSDPAYPYLYTGAGSAAGGGAFPLPLPIQSVPQALRLAMPIIAITMIRILLM